MNATENITYGEKFTGRALSCGHPVVKKRIKILSAIDYTLHIHRDSNLDTSKPIFTIILTIYDTNIKFVEESLKSVFSQSYQNTEIILINNGADGTVGELVWSTFLANRNAKYIRVLTHLYNPAANDLDDPIPNLWNAGLFCSVGDFVYFMSYDDILSSNYVELMVALFASNQKCCTAAPSVVSINELSEINKDISEQLRVRNSREKYTDGIVLARNYMRGGNLILFPGGLLATKATLVLECGGFDNINDLSQLVKFAVNGDSGFAPEAKLYWRHHSNQANRIQKKLGLIYYKNYMNFAKLYDIEQFHQRIAGAEFAEEFRRYLARKAENEAINSFRDSYRIGVASGIKALIGLILECPPRVSIKASYYLFRDVGLLRNFARKLHGSIPSFRLFIGNHFKNWLLEDMRNNRLHYPEWRNGLGADLTFIEYQHNASPPSRYLHDLLNGAIHFLDDEWRQNSEFRRLSPRLNFLYDYNNHYLLLTSLARVLNAKNIVEVGTASGNSLWAWLRADCVEKISTWDILPLRKNAGWFPNAEIKKLVENSILQDSRWIQYVEDLSDPENWSSRVSLFCEADVIFIDGPHDGRFEQKLVDQILKLQNDKSIFIIFDDIQVSSMVDFWRDLPLQKLDATSVGHQSGTGIATLPPWLSRKEQHS